MHSTSIKRPALPFLFSEAGRALVEFSGYLTFSHLLKIAEKGDDHPVLVLPGFMASDVSTFPLRRLLSDIHYTTHGWELGRNFGHVAFLTSMCERVSQLFQIHQEPISLIGWSLGGVYAREVAKELPHMVRQVITLGSPFADIMAPNNVTWIYNLVNKVNLEDLAPELIERLPLPPPVPVTAIYSKEDGVVSWKTCKELVESDIHQNIQVRGSHFGLGVNVSVLRIIIDRLAHHPDSWSPFIPKTHWERRMFYPSL